jgi:hypothetical protein
MHHERSAPKLDVFAALLNQELAGITNTRRRQFAESILVLPSKKTLRWEYGANEEFESWVFANFRERNVGAAYCLGGHGALGSPWGLVFFHSDAFGQDCGWYPTLAALVDDWGLDAGA